MKSKTHEHFISAFCIDYLICRLLLCHDYILYHAPILHLHVLTLPYPALPCPALPCPALYGEGQTRAEEESSPVLRGGDKISYGEGRKAVPVGYKNKNMRKGNKRKERAYGFYTDIGF